MHTFCFWAEPTKEAFAFLIFVGPPSKCLGIGSHVTSGELFPHVGHIIAVEDGVAGLAAIGGGGLGRYRLLSHVC